MPPQYARPETELLLCCASPPGIEKRGERIRALAGQSLDWDWLLPMAAAHALTPLLYWELKGAQLNPLPAALEQSFRANTLNSFHLTAQLFTLLDLLEHQAIHALPFKGPTLALASYGNLALREFFDLDLLVRKEDVLRARDVLLQNGYTADLQLSKEREEAYLNVYDELLLRGPEGQPLIELHWALTPRYFSVALDVAPFWDRAEPVCLGSRQVPSLCTEDLLLVVCLHAAKHCWSHLSMVSDLAWLMARRTIQWDLVLERARRLGSLRMVLLGADLAGSLLKVPLPPAVARCIADDPAVPLLSAQVTAGFFQPRGGEGVILRAGSFHMKAREHWQDRVRYFVRLATTVSIEDWEVADLPPSLAFLYTALRFPRLVRKYWMRIP